MIVKFAVQLGRHSIEFESVGLDGVCLVQLAELTTNCQGVVRGSEVRLKQQL